MLVVVSTAFAKFGPDCIGVVAPCFVSDIADPVSSLGISLLGDPGVHNQSQPPQSHVEYCHLRVFFANECYFYLRSRAELIVSSAQSEHYDSW